VACLHIKTVNLAQSAYSRPNFVDATNFVTAARPSKTPTRGVVNISLVPGVPFPLLRIPLLHSRDHNYVVVALFPCYFYC